MNFQDGQSLFEYVRDELLEGGECEEDSKELYQSCMNVLEDGEALSRIFRDSDEDDAFLTGIVEDAWSIAGDKLRSLEEG